MIKKILILIICLVFISCSSNIKYTSSKFPKELNKGDEIIGLASYYAEKYNGKKTASGELYDSSILTAAHKTLEFGTIVEVENIKNNKTVRVRINDRGPFVAGRIIDLSKKAAEQLEMIEDGVIEVKIRILRK